MKEIRGHNFTLALGALGVVFGDIGTSPLYAVRECFYGSHGIAPTPDNVLGVLSLIFWTLTIIVSIKYLLFVLRADVKGEGGVMALLAIISKHHSKEDPARYRLYIYLGLFGAALIYGDGVLTPAISVLSAVEGLQIATPLFESFVVPITLLILTVLFLLQRHGTGRIGAVFGPVILIWFLVLSILGIYGIVQAPRVLEALNPVLAISFFKDGGFHGFMILGAVFLVATGAEALYADMGHFGRGPIRIAWFSVAFPALVLNYFGQAALLLNDPSAARNPFYLLAPSYFLYPLVALSTCATIIASQALISGAFSLTHQAVQLGFLPRLTIKHTSSNEIGQIYVPLVNWALFFSVVYIVFTFQSSDKLAGAYGVAVSTTMIITSILILYIARNVWRWRLSFVLILFVILITVDFAFFAVNISKIGHGGWLPLLMGGVVYTIMSTWRRGREILANRLQAMTLSSEKFIEQLNLKIKHRTPGCAIFMARTPNSIPSALFHNAKHNHVIHERVFIVTVLTKETPHVDPAESLEVLALGENMYSVYINSGFMDSPNVPDILKRLADHGIEPPSAATTYFLSRETVIATPLPGMAQWREHFFAFMSRNAQRAAAYFKIPSDQVIEVGVQVRI